jgi:hypothetical protein
MVGLAGRLPTPFFRLACRILDIRANSATCERLWSIFGATLTKLRNRLGVKTLTALGELKMHIGTSIVQRGSRLKHTFFERGKNQTTPSSASRNAHPPRKRAWLLKMKNLVAPRPPISTGWSSSTCAVQKRTKFIRSLVVRDVYRSPPNDAAVRF